MKMNLPDFNQYLKRLNYGSDLRPSRDWLRLLAVFALFILLSVGWNLWSFSRVTGGNALGTESQQTLPNPVNPDRVNALFQERALEEARYLTEYRFVDPSQ